MLFDASFYFISESSLVSQGHFEACSEIATGDAQSVLSWQGVNGAQSRCHVTLLTMFCFGISSCTMVPVFPEELHKVTKPTYEWNIHLVSALMFYVLLVSLMVSYFENCQAWRSSIHTGAPTATRNSLAVAEWFSMQLCNVLLKNCHQMHMPSCIFTNYLQSSANNRGYGRRRVPEVS